MITLRWAGARWSAWAGWSSWTTGCCAAAPLGGVLGFAIGGALLLPIGYVYGQLVTAMPDAAGEVAYTAKVFPRSVSFATGWMMMLAYFIVCPWEAVAVGKIAGLYLSRARFSASSTASPDGRFILPHVVIGSGIDGASDPAELPWHSAQRNFSELDCLRDTLALFVIFVACGVSKGSPQNLAATIYPWRVSSPVLLVIQIVPYYMTGFESVVKGAEEANPEFRSGGFLKAIWMAIVVGILFYTIVIAAVGYVAPWREAH